MWCRLALCVVLGGCGFHFNPEVADSGASNGSSNCFQRWFDGPPSLALSAPKELTALASAGDDRDPWISADGLRLYFARNPGVHGDSDIYLTTRTSPAEDFGNPGPVDNLDTPAAESRAAVNGDDTLLVFSSNRGPVGKFQIFVSTRNDVTKAFPSPSVPDQVLIASVNTVNTDYFDPFLSKDGLRLYVAPRPAGSPQQIALATRMPDQNFEPSMPVPVINSGTSIDADPALSLDERIIVFSSTRPAGPGLGATNLWYATRQNATDNFTAPQLIPMVNTDTDDGDPMLSADGCELYFASRRAPGGKYQLFHAQVSRPS